MSKYGAKTMRAAILTAALIALASPALAGELRVNVTGIRSATGQVGCALYADPRSFLSDAGIAAVRWQPADPAGVQCRFDNLPPGIYAVAVTHDVNGNRRTDTNLLGMPTEDWGMSNNPRPTLRAPRFDEAAIQVPNGPAVTIEVRLAR